jgi:hypothetical protein
VIVSPDFAGTGTEAVAPERTATRTAHAVRWSARIRIV